MAGPALTLMLVVVSGWHPSFPAWCLQQLTFLVMSLIYLLCLKANWYQSIAIPLCFLRAHLWWNSCYGLTSASSSLSVCLWVPRQVLACSTFQVSALPCTACPASSCCCHRRCCHHHLSCLHCSPRNLLRRHWFGWSTSSKVSFLALLRWERYWPCWSNSIEPTVSSEGIPAAESSLPAWAP